MRLSLSRQQSIANVAKQVFGDKVKVWLFGSRLDDSKRGGDIDLLISLEKQLSAEDELTQLAKFKHQLYRAIGEQKIDTQFLTSPATEFQQLILIDAIRL